MSARLARLSLLAIPVVFGILTIPAWLAAQCPMADCGSMMKGHGGGMMSSKVAPPSTGAAPSETTAKAQATEIWGARCAACHGPDGRGDGPGAAGLKPKPVNFHNRGWQKAVTDDQIAKAIVEGGGAVGLSNQMAANPDLEDEPAVVKALVAHVRGLGK